MIEFATFPLPEHPTVTAPDGSDVRVLLGLAGGGMAHFHLGAGRVSKAVAHRTVEEIWFITTGRGRMWRRQDGREEVVELRPGLCLSIPLGTAFQFSAAADEGVSAVAVTMPPWPGMEEAVEVEGPWAPSLPAA